MSLPYFRRPPDLGGSSRDPVWCIAQTDLGRDLLYRADPARADHRFVEPCRPMTLGEHQQALAQTQAAWRRI